jgi:peptidylamidoglycolate lyase
MLVRTVATGLAAVFLLATPVAVQQSRYGPERGGEDETGPYEVVPNWPQPIPGFEGLRWGSTAGVFAETPNKIFIFQRGFLPPAPAGRGGGTTPPTPATSLQPQQWTHCLFIVDGSGKMIDAWTQHDKLFVRPHKVLINPYDPEKHVWLVDDGAHQVFKFTNDGKNLVMVLGEAKVPGNDEKHFARPTDIAWLPDGTFFVSDGYTNTRVVKFDKDGKFLMTWGKPASGPKPGPSEFNTVHGIAIDNKRRIYVSDRGHSRIQIFDENGKYLDEWPNLRQPYHLFMSVDQHLWVSDGVSNKILKFDLTGKLLDSWGTYGQFPGGLWGGHQISVDQDGNLYVAEVFNGRVQKLRPRKGVDTARLVGQPLRFKASGLR